MVSNKENWEFDHEDKLENMEEWVEFQDFIFWSLDLEFSDEKGRKVLS